LDVRSTERKGPSGALNSLKRHRFDVGLVVVASALLLAGCFAKTASVSEAAPGPQTIVEAPAPLPLAALTKMRVEKGTTSYSIDVVRQGGRGDQVIATRPAQIALAADSASIAGWAVDLPQKLPASALYVTLDHKAVSPCLLMVPRPDVASALNGKQYGTSGFSCEIPAKFLKHGRHLLGLDIVSATRNSYYAISAPTVLNVR